MNGLIAGMSATEAEHLRKIELATDDEEWAAVRSLSQSGVRWKAVRAQAILLMLRRCREGYSAITLFIPSRMLCYHPAATLD